MSELIIRNKTNNLNLNNNKLALKEILSLNEITNKKSLFLTKEQAIDLIDN